MYVLINLIFVTDQILIEKTVELVKLFQMGQKLKIKLFQMVQVKYLMWKLRCKFGTFSAGSVLYLGTFSAGSILYFFMKTMEIF